jgi:hypothetical protein
MAFAVLAVVTLPTLSGLPEDSPRNDFVFQPATFGAADATAMTNDIAAFFTTANTTNAIDGYLSHRLARSPAVATVKFYDITTHLNGSAHGGPVFSTTFVLSHAAINAQDLPDESAMAVSYNRSFGTDVEFGPPGQTIASTDAAIDQGAPLTHLGRTRPRSSDRGRIFIGPLNAGAVNVASTSSGLGLAAIAVADLKVATVRLKASTSIWSVWSKKTSSVGSIAGGFISDGVRTQRRRRVEERTRTIWP